MLRLKQAIADGNILTCALLVAEKFTPRVKASDYEQHLQTLVEQLASTLEQNHSREKSFRQLVNCFYTELAFSGNDQDFFASRYSLLDQVIDYRTGIPVTLSIVFCHLAKQLGFDVYGVNFPGHFLLRFQVSDARALFVDPLSGEFLDWPRLEEMYFTILGELEEESMPVEALDPASCEETIIRLLNNLKAAFIKEQQFQQALLSVEYLVELTPDDPYERRDRGFLLHQLECPQVALADYQYFIRRCPQDPAAQLLKLQIRHMNSHSPLVLH